MSTEDGPSETYPVQPSAEAEVHRYYSNIPDPPPDNLPPATSRQFSLSSLLCLMVLACLGFAAFAKLPRPIFAGFAGGISVLGLIILTVFKPPWAIIHLGWWLVLSIYLLASLLAALGI